MKNIAVLLFLFLLSFSCKGQNNKPTYARQSESELNGNIKKVTHYICPIEQYGSIPTDTTHYETRITTTYDTSGKKLEENNFYRYNNSITEYITIYSGSGKNRTFIESSISGLENKKEIHYEYVWTDDYHFKVIPTDSSDKSNFNIEYTLDKNFRTIKTVGKQGDKIKLVDEYKYELKGNKVIKKTLKRTVEEGETDRIVYVVIVPQKFDSLGNPTMTNIYDEPDTKRIARVSFTIYEYYEAEAKHPNSR